MCYLFLVLPTTLIKFNHGLHLDLLVELSQAVLVDLSLLRLDVVGIPHEPQVALLALQSGRAVHDHQRLEVDEKLNARIHIYLLY